MSYKKQIRKKCSKGFIKILALSWPFFFPNREKERKHIVQRYLLISIDDFYISYETFQIKASNAQSANHMLNEKNKKKNGHPAKDKNFYRNILVPPD